MVQLEKKNEGIIFLEFKEVRGQRNYNDKWKIQRFRLETLFLPILISF